MWLKNILQVASLLHKYITNISLSQYQQIFTYVFIICFFICWASDPATPICTAVTPVYLPFPITWPPPPTCTPALNYPSAQLHMYQPSAIYSPPWSLTVLLPQPSSNFLSLSVFATLLGMGQEIITIFFSFTCVAPGSKVVFFTLSHKPHW